MEQVPATLNETNLPNVIGTTSLGLGHESIEGINEIEIPRAKLVQFTSDEAQAKNPADRIQPGIIINSITRQEIGNVFVPVFKYTTFTCWNPRKKDDVNYDPAYELGEIIFQTNDPKDPRVIEGTKFGPNGEAPKVTRYMNFLTYFPGQNMPLVLSFAKTSMKAGERLNTLLIANGGNVWGHQYKIITTQREGSAGSYFAFDVGYVGKSDLGQTKVGELWYNMFHKQTLKVHAETVSE